MSKLPYSDEGIQNQKALIGEFFISFEQICDYIRFIIPMIIFKEIPNEENKNNVEILLTDITMNNLLDKFNALISENYKAYPKLIQTNNRLHSKIAELSKIRNSFAHGSYRLGWENFKGDLSNESFSLRHSKSKKTGYEKRSYILSIEKLKVFNSNLKKVDNCYGKISSAILNINLDNSKIFNNIIDDLSNELNSIDKLDFKSLILNTLN